MNQELLALFAARKGHFRYESGHHGHLWLDLDTLFLRPHKLRRFVVGLAERLSQHKGAALCGPLVGGALLAEMVATELEAEFFYTEPFALPDPDALYPVEYRLPKGLGQLLGGKPVIIMDDVINAGSAVRGTFAELKRWGARPVAIAALLVLGSSTPSYFSEQHIPVESVAALPNNLWLPGECPLCAAKMPLENIKR